MMKFLFKASSIFELDKISSELSAKDIEFITVRVPREYTSIVLGGQHDIFNVLVDERDILKAQALLKAINTVQSENTEPTSIETNYLTRVIVFSLLSLTFIPVLFNLAATFNFKRMLKQDRSKLAKLMATIVFFIMWIVAVIEVVYIVSILSN